MTCQKRGLGPFSALGWYFALSCLLHSLMIASSYQSDQFSGGWHKGLQYSIENDANRRALTVTMVALSSAIPQQPSIISTEKLKSTSPQQEVPEAGPVPAKEMKSPTQQRVFHDFELDMQATPVLPPELDETLLLPEDEQGKLQLLLLISAAGEVLWAYVEATELSPETSEMLAEHFRQTRFHPGKVGYRPVDSLYRVEVSLTAARPAP